MAIFRRNSEAEASFAAPPVRAERRAAASRNPTSTSTLGSNPGSTWIGEHALLEGKIVTAEDICIQGRLTGIVESEGLVVIPEGGRVEADVSARNVAIHGQVVGNIEAAEQAEIGATGSLIGAIHAAAVVVRPGAVFKGTVKRRAPDSSGPPAAVEPQAAAP